MPKHGEMKRKINLLKHNKNVRPPLNWWNKMLPTIKGEYPTYDRDEIDQVLGGIWNNYSIETKIKIIKEYQKDDDSAISDSEKRSEEIKILGRMI